jgi:RHH-type transcriptional regulator, rel operon repressor / antitoxin RelB
MNTCIAAEEPTMPTSIRLDSEIEKRLNDLAAKTGRIKAYYMREAIHDYLEDREDYEIAKAASERRKRGEERTYSSAEIRKELGLDD